MKQPKWFKNDRDLKVGDVVLFLKNNSIITSTYQYGMVCELYPGKDKKIRKAKISYRNHTENVSRETVRAVRELVVIHYLDELDVTQELNNLFD
jgi:hypothetical protein